MGGTDEHLTGGAASAGTFHALRLLAGADLVAGMRAAFAATGAEAAAVASCVGSLSRVRLRYAGRAEAVGHEGPFEIVSLTGTLDPHHQHLHIALADGDGAVIGGHLMPEGAEVYTTAEIVLLTLDDIAFARVPCPVSGFRELSIARRGAGQGFEAE